LIADDEPFNIMTLEGLLDFNNVDCSKAYDGQSAIDKLNDSMAKKCLNHKNIKLLILDNSMPIMSGIEVATVVRNKMVEGIYPTDIMIVLLTGERATSLSDLIFSRNNKNRNGGLFDYIYEKPIKEKDLKYLLNECGLGL
jgi:CheY-like chemotaxis protein